MAIQKTPWFVLPKKYEEYEQDLEHFVQTSAPGSVAPFPMSSKFEGVPGVGKEETGTVRFTIKDGKDYYYRARTGGEWYIGSLPPGFSPGVKDGKLVLAHRLEIDTYWTEEAEAGVGLKTALDPIMYPESRADVFMLPAITEEPELSGVEGRWIYVADDGSVTYWISAAHVFDALRMFAEMEIESIGDYVQEIEEVSVRRLTFQEINHHVFRVDDVIPGKESVTTMALWWLRGGCEPGVIACSEW